MSGLVDGKKALENLFDLGEGNLVRAVGKGVGRVAMDFHEDPIDSGCDSGPGQNRCEASVSSRGSSKSAGSLN